MVAARSAIRAGLTARLTARLDTLPSRPAARRLSATVLVFVSSLHCQLSLPPQNDLPHRLWHQPQQHGVTQACVAGELTREGKQDRLQLVHTRREPLAVLSLEEGARDPACLRGAE